MKKVKHQVFSFYMLLIEMSILGPTKSSFVFLDRHNLSYSFFLQSPHNFISGILVIVLSHIRFKLLVCVCRDHPRNKLYIQVLQMFSILMICVTLFRGIFLYFIFEVRIASSMTENYLLTNGIGYFDDFVTFSTELFQTLYLEFVIAQ